MIEGNAVNSGTNTSVPSGLSAVALLWFKTNKQSKKTKLPCTSLEETDQYKRQKQASYFFLNYCYVVLIGSFKMASVPVTYLLDIQR